MRASSPRIHFIVICVSILCVTNGPSVAQTRRSPAGGPVAVVVDERLAALRQTPELSGKLIQRLSRGRLVTIRRAVRARDGINFYYVRVTRRRGGWLQREAVVSASRAGEDQRLYRLLQASDGFDLIWRGRIFLDMFPRSPLRPAVLKIFASAADAAADKLSREANRRLNEKEMMASGGLEISYFLNYSGLDRYNRQGIRFVFDQRQKRLNYDGAAWREIMRRYPKATEAEEAHRHLTARGSARIQ